MFIDSHAHIYDAQFADDFNEMLLRAQENGIEKILMPNCDEETLLQMLAIQKSHKGTCYAMLGLHPCYVKEHYKDALHNLKKYLGKAPFIAIGEIGLDFYWDKSHIAEQEQALEIQIQWALEHNLPIVLHTRDSIDETISIVKKYIAQGLRGVFHCFSGNEIQAKEITEELGFYIGIGGVLSFKNSGLKNAIQNINMNNIILETDAPYLAPSPFRGKRNEPSYIKLIANHLAEIKKLDDASIENITSANCAKLFNLVL